MSVPDLEKLLVEVARNQRSHYFGKYRGIVVDDPYDSDEKGRGRVKLKVPNLLGDVVLTASPCLPFAGKGHGVVFLPEAGDGVWVEFEGGDLSHPIWSGCWFADDEMTRDMRPGTYCLITSKGLNLLLDDNNNQIVLKHSAGASIVLDDKGICLSMGAVKLEITNTGFVVNDGAFEVGL